MLSKEKPIFETSEQLHLQNIFISQPRVYEIELGCRPWRCRIGKNVKFHGTNCVYQGKEKN